MFYVRLREHQKNTTRELLANLLTKSKGKWFSIKKTKIEGQNSILLSNKVFFFLAFTFEVGPS
jgi:hypothetical protein